jgi:hypothetical protein
MVLCFRPGHDSARDPLTYASRVAWITGAGYHAWLVGCDGNLTFWPGQTQRVILLISAFREAGITGMNLSQR